MLSGFLQKVALLVWVLPYHAEGKDLLNPKPDLPQELNDFLNDVQQHKRDFAFIRNAAKNQKKYEKTFREGSDLLAEDIDTQFNLNPDLNSNKQDNAEDDSLLDAPRAGSYEDREKQRLYAGFESPSGLKKYPNERYSRNLHSPVRLRRELDNQIQVNPNSELGKLQRPNYPDGLENSNKYHTGHMIGFNNKKKKKKKKRREVEISIKSDGKLVKHIEEDENGPKSIILNIKANNPSVKVAEEGSTEGIFAKSQPDSRENSIPNVASSGGLSNAQTSNQNKNIGVPINSIPARSNQIGDGSEPQELADVNKVVKVEKPPLHLGGNYNDRWSGDNSHMAKSIDIAQNNLNSLSQTRSKLEKYPSLTDMGFGADYKKNDFEKVQGMVVEPTKQREMTKYKKRDNHHEYDYMDPLDLGTSEEPQSVHIETEEDQLHLETNHPYEILEKSTKDILVVPITTTTECPVESEEEKEAEEIGEAIAEEIEEELEESTTPVEEEIEIIRHNEDEDECDQTTETIVVHEHHKKHHHKHHHHHRNHDPSKRKIRKSHLNKLHDNDQELRDRKHLPTMPKYKRKRVRQHPRKMARNHQEALASWDYYDLNEMYDDSPGNREYIPSFRQRGLKSVEYEFDPHLIQDVDNREVEDLQKFVGTMEVNSKDVAEKKGVRKKFKTDGDYSDEEDTITTSPVEKVPVKKTRNEFAMERATTAQDNDDDYDYSDLTDMDDEDEDIAYEEVDHDKLDADEAVGNTSKEDVVEKDRLSEEATRPYRPRLSNDEAVESTSKQAVDGATKSYRHQLQQSSLGIVTSFTAMNVEDVLMEADQMLAGAHAHGQAGPKKNKKKNMLNPGRAPVQKNRSKRASADHPRRRRKRRRKRRKRKHSKPLTSPMDSNLHQPEPLSDRQKQDLFLRYNPDFQRWPRFVESDQKFHEMMRRRAVEDRRKFYHNTADNFPISNEYVLKPKQVKREDAATASSEAATSSEVSSTTLEAGAESTTLSEAGAAASSSVSETSAASPSGESQLTEAASDAVESLLTGLDQGSFTLPQAAQNILQTANSDIFENTTVPELGVQQGGAAANDSSGREASTPFQFTTIAEDLTTNPQCGENATHKRVEVCEDESAKHSPGTVTSVLPLIKEAATESLNLTKDQFLDLDEILAGVLPTNVVIDSLNNAKGSVRQGLRGGKFNLNLLLAGYNSSAEANLILTEMASLMKKLKYHTSCQPLSPNLKTYLKIITKNEMDDPMMRLKEINDIDFDDHQSNYVFHASQNENVQDKAQVLRDLLAKYQNLPTDCKERAEPVKEYIESHLAMVEHMGGSKAAKVEPATEAPPATSARPKVKKEISMADAAEEMKEKKLEGPMVEQGLGNQKTDANQLIEEMEEKTDKKDVVDSKMLYREISTSTSPQFGKLSKAVRTVRSRREVIERIGQIYGRAMDHQENDIVKRDLAKIDDKGFEAPRVINF